uniref:Methyltransferase domain-containing protein n=1 Tax=viral metagenome TaxID=1070528 RepID=A0A6C0DBC3_9ZZZZ
MYDVWWPALLSVTIVVLCGIYVWEMSKSYRKVAKLDLEGIEAFANPAGEESRVDNDCYDLFYSKVYDKIVQPEARAAMEVQVPLEWFKKEGRELDTLRVADLGCGTGLHVELYARAGVHSVAGYDRSEAMVTEARRRFPERKFEVGDMLTATLMPAGSVDLISAYYFLIYMTPDRRTMLRNIYLWLAPGGVFVCHIVNKLKFDPVLESASPFVGFSVQKYADERITGSAVTFEEFEYKGDFQLHGGRGTYEEVFDFRDGRRRRHEQRVWMPNIDVLTAEIQGVGFKILHHVDLTAIGYEYNYLFFFGR